MSKVLFVALLLPLGIALVAASAPAPNDRPCTARETQARLDQRFNFTGVRAETPLKDGLEILSNSFHIAIFLDIKAFQNDLQILEPENMPIQLPRLDNISCRFVLEEMLKQSEGTYYVDADGVVWVTSAQRSLIGQRLRHAVRARFDNQPLAEALRELSQKHDISIVLDERRAGERARARVSANFCSVRFETAVGLLADMAELKVVDVGRALYVTTAEHARDVRAQQERHEARFGKQEVDDYPPPPRIGFFELNGAVPPRLAPRPIR